MPLASHAHAVNKAEVGLRSHGYLKKRAAPTHNPETDLLPTTGPGQCLHRAPECGK